ncbi:ATP-dependent helicase [Candidatus Micrarchaeota archaeon]|nr:ATP-dependent helicase [Candidatus Micrarchaeota archaeon]
MEDRLIRAGPGTGKTENIIQNIIRLVEDEKVDPSKILCITYTNSAVKEITERLSERLKSKSYDIEVHTFHSFALSKLDQDNFKMIDDSVKRFVIYRLLIDRKVFNYGEDYIKTNLLTSIISMIDYIKCYGITVDKIKKHKKQIISYLNQLSKKELGSYKVDDYERFLNHLVNVYQGYEIFKQDKGYYDYTDMLYLFIKEHEHTVFDYDYVFVDELQDANILEAKVARIAANKFNREHHTRFYLVGDAKQSIFGFQGGSLVNFREFSEECKVEELKQNYRSCQEIIDYSAEFMETNSGNLQMINEAKKLKSDNDCRGEVYYKLINNDDKNLIIRHIITKNKGKEIGIITRTNSQAEEISHYLSENDIEHYCSTPKLGSLIVKEGIINLLDSLFHIDDPQKLVNGVSSPFSGVNMAELIKVYTVNRRKNSKGYPVDVKFDDIKDNKNFSKFVDMAELVNFAPDDERDFAKNLKTLFEKYILPVSVAFGEEGIISTVKLYNAVLKYYEQIDIIKPNDILLYLHLVDVSEQRESSKKKISVTTVHKSKGLAYDVVIYLPSSTQSGYKLIENTEHAILSSITPAYDKDEINEESVRVDYVAFTRARYKLFVLLSDNGRTKKFKERYILSTAEEYDYNPVDKEEAIMTDVELSYASLFSEMIGYLNNKDIESLVRAVESFKVDRNEWIKQLITDKLRNGFKTLSYSSLTSPPIDILINKVLGISGESTEALDLGSNVHKFYEQMYMNDRTAVNDDERLWKKQWDECVDTLKMLDPNIEQISAEEKINLGSEGIRDIFGFRPDWAERLTGKIDAVFKGDSLWIIDYKTSKTSKNSNYTMQLIFYKELYAQKYNISIDDLNAAIFYVLLRDTVNDENGSPVYSTDVKTIKKHSKTIENKRQAFIENLKRIDSYIQNPDMFIADLEGDLNNHFGRVQYRDLVARFIEEYKRSVSE